MENIKNWNQFNENHNGFSSREEVEELRKELLGKCIKLIKMYDDFAVEPGTVGKVRLVDDIGNIHINWENGSKLALIPNHDEYEIIDCE